MDPLTTLNRLQQHRNWANHKLRDAARSLSPAQLNQTFDIGLGSVMKTLTHLHGAEDVWLIALKGQPNTPSSFDYHYDSFAKLESAWDQSELGWSTFLHQLTAEDLARPIDKVNKVSGERYTTPMHDILLHVCMHAHYHSAQAVNMMRHLGVPGNKLPDLMLISMSRQEPAG